MELEKNIYGLSEGIFKACQFLGLKFPSEVPKELQSSDEHMPSDYFGDDFEFNAATRKKLCAECKLTPGEFKRRYKSFSTRFAAQKPLKQTKTDLNVYFCDLMLFLLKEPAVGDRDYFNFEFYRKSAAACSLFRTQRHRFQTRTICNEYNSMSLVNNKYETNALFADFLHRDWLYMRNCSFAEFKAFVEKHPRFFSKLAASSFGEGAEIINVAPDENLEKLFAKLKREQRLLEEVITQHEELSAFCPNSVNTIRVNTILDIHGVVHILTTSGKFGRGGRVVDNFNGGGVAAIIDPKTGIITSDAINSIHERFDRHPDTGKTFKGFQYPCWQKLRDDVTSMAKLMPQMRHIGWDITINDKGEPVLVEANGNPDPGSQQSADSVGRAYLYQPLLDEILHYKMGQMRLLGYRVNKLKDFDSSYNDPSRKNSRLKFAIGKLIPDCSSLMDVGCRKTKLAKSNCPEGVKYFPVDFKAHDDEIIACNFNENFPDIKVDTCLCALTAEYVERLPQFIANMCNAAQKQILMICRPINDRALLSRYRWEHPFLTDFTEEFLIQTMEQNNFRLDKQYPIDINSVILYDFRKISK